MMRASCCVRVLIVMSLMICPRVAVAQQPATPGSVAGVAAPADDLESLRTQIGAAMQKRDWEHGLELLGQLTAAAPGDAQALHDVGYCLHSVGRYEEGLAADRKAAAAAAPGTRVHQTSSYNVACALAMLGRADEALDALEVSIAAGYRNAEFMEYDAELASLRGVPRFRDLMAGLRAGRTKVAIIVHENVEMLDFAGPAEVFSQASDPDGSSHYAVMLVGLTHAPVHAQGISGAIVPEYSIADCPAPDIVVVPGGDTRVLTDDAAFMAWVEKVAPDADVMMSVCTGAGVYAKAGLLHGLPATTHFSAIASLRRNYPDIDVREGVRFVDNGHVITTAGISAGIDGALAVVRRQVGEPSAAGAARSMEYAWHPE